ncbi:MAG: AtpZ/AtpI family protein [Myxococcota bacterium]|nr:AtpZ/AtpI family protein [Myxococcota bacterium]
MNDLKDKAGIASIGIEMGGCVTVGYLMGSWVDGQFGSDPWGTYFFLVCGFGAAIKGLIRVVRKAQRMNADSTKVTSSHLGLGSYQGYGS